MFATIATIVIATNVYAQEDFKYYICDGEVTNLNPNFNVSLNRDELKYSFWSGCTSHYYPIFDNNHNTALNKCNILANYLNQIINFDDEHGIYCYETTHNLYLRFYSPFICKSNIYKLNHIIYNGNSVLTCRGTINVFVAFDGYYGCKNDIEDNHIFEHYVRCASSKNGYLDIPYQGKCTCLPGANGPLCQYTDKDTCSCNGKANMNGFCTCNPGYSGLYCNIGDPTLQPVNKITTTKTVTAKTATTAANKITNTKTAITANKITNTKTATTAANKITNTKTATTAANKITNTKTATAKTATTDNKITTTKTTTTDNTYESISIKHKTTIVILVIIIIVIFLPISVIYSYYKCKKHYSIPPIPPQNSLDTLTSLDKSNNHACPSYENPVYDATGHENEQITYENIHMHDSSV